MQQDHLIQKLVFDLRVPDADQGKELHGLISSRCSPGLLAAISDVFDAAAPKERLVIDRLEIDLQKFSSSEALMSELIDGVTAQLREALAGKTDVDAIQRHGLGAGMATTESSPLPKPFELFSYFLTHGVLPWNSGIISRNELLKSLLAELGREPRLHARLREFLAASRSSRQRLTKQLTDTELIEILTMLSPAATIENRWEIYTLQQAMQQALAGPEERNRSWEILVEVICDRRYTDFRQVIDNVIRSFLALGHQPQPDANNNPGKTMLDRLATIPAFEEIAGTFRELTLQKTKTAANTGVSLTNQITPWTRVSNRGNAINIMEDQQPLPAEFLPPFADLVLYSDDFFALVNPLAATVPAIAATNPNPAHSPLPAQATGALGDEPVSPRLIPLWDPNHVHAKAKTSGPEQQQPRTAARDKPSAAAPVKTIFHRDKLLALDRYFAAEKGRKADAAETGPAPAAFAEPEEIYVTNSGLVLLAPFFSHLFDQVGLKDKNGFKDDTCRQRGVHLLHYLATGQENPPEYELFLNKILCGCDPYAPVELMVELSTTDKEEADELLRAAISSWTALKNTTPVGFRSSFLLRRGVLTDEGNNTRLLRVKRESIDILLDTLPWSYSLIKYSWMKSLLRVAWQG